MKKDQLPRHWVIGRQNGTTNTSIRDNVDPETGIRRIAFLSFYEDERKTRINSLQTFENWRHNLPLLEFENDLIEGWRILTNFRRSTTRQLFFIEEPRYHHQFELSVEKIILMLRNIHVIDGVIQGRWALKRDRSLISEEEYNALKENKVVLQRVDTLNKYDVIRMKNKQYIYTGKLKMINIEHKSAETEGKLRISEYITESFIKYNDNLISGMYTQRQTLPKVQLLRKCTSKEQEDADSVINEFCRDGQFIPFEKPLVPKIQIITDDRERRWNKTDFYLRNGSMLYYCTAETQQVANPPWLYTLSRIEWDTGNKWFVINDDETRIAGRDSHMSSGIEPVRIVF